MAQQAAQGGLVAPGRWHRGSQLYWALGLGSGAAAILAVGLHGQAAGGGTQGVAAHAKVGGQGRRGAAGCLVGAHTMQSEAEAG